MKTCTPFEKGLIAIIALVAVVVGIPWRAYVFTVLWRWFVVPIFDAPTLGIVQAMGLLSVVYFTRPDFPKKKKADDKEADEEWLIKMTLHVLFSPAIALLIGWIITRFL